MALDKTQYITQLKNIFETNILMKQMENIKLHILFNTTVFWHIRSYNLIYKYQIIRRYILDNHNLNITAVENPKSQIFFCFQTTSIQIKSL